MRRSETRSADSRGPVPESYLLLAERARNEAARRRWARTGLRLSSNKETSFLLLEQLFKADFREGDYRSALDAATAMIRLEMLADGAWARAAACHLALGDLDNTEKALRQAVAKAPGQRRAYHLWSLGAFLHMHGRLAEALQAFGRGERIASSPLTRAHAAAVRCELGEPPAQIDQLVQDLEADPTREGYGRFVLGLLYRHEGDAARASENLQAFVRRCEEDPRERAVTLARELEIARRLLGETHRARVIPIRAARRAR
ncbi:MAG: hypothetical protein HYY06_14070 [Deltaproteobacteria bacterium]|nr:hypothetical protein [Deltaproteobacteria bacterium]